MVEVMEYDLKRINTMVIKPLVASLIIAGYFAGMFTASF
jgi:hypothetical protein